MAHLHIIRIVHDILDHIFQNGVTGEDWVYLRVHVLRLKKINTFNYKFHSNDVIIITVQPPPYTHTHTCDIEALNSASKTDIQTVVRDSSR